MSCHRLQNDFLCLAEIVSLHRNYVCLRREASTSYHVVRSSTHPFDLIDIDIWQPAHLPQLSTLKFWLKGLSRFGSLIQNFSVHTRKKYEKKILKESEREREREQRKWKMISMEDWSSSSGIKKGRREGKEIGKEQKRGER